MRWRNDNMLLRIAQGDAYALGAEYVKRKEHPELIERLELFEGYQQHPNPAHGGLRAGSYSDDTQMSIAIAEVLIEKGARASSLDYTDAFFRCFKRDPRDGYSRGFQAILERARTPAELRQLVTPDSNKNGAAMRAVPIGALRDPNDVAAAAGMQASSTHATWGGINSAVIVALMSHYALYDRRSLGSMPSWLANHCQALEYFKGPWEGPVTGKATNLGVGMNTAWAAMTLVSEATSLKNIMERVLAWGGDTDSVAAVAWGVASCRFQDEVLPEFMEPGLEAQGNPKYGPEFLKSLGKRLMDTTA